MKAVDEEWCRRIHDRLLADDPTATAELAENVGNIVFEKLRKKHPRRDLEMVHDAAWDAIRAYMERPTTFDPSKRSLVGYLVSRIRSRVNIGHGYSQEAPWPIAFALSRSARLTGMSLSGFSERRRRRPGSVAGLA